MQIQTRVKPPCNYRKALVVFVDLFIYLFPFFLVFLRAVVRPGFTTARGGAGPSQLSPVGAVGTHELWGLSVHP